MCVTLTFFFGCETVSGLSDDIGSASETAVCPPCTSLDGDRSQEGPIRHSKGAGFRQFGGFDVARSVSGVRHRRSHHSAAPTDVTYGLDNVVLGWFRTYLT